MPPTTKDRRAALRDTLLDLAEAQIAAGGLRSLRARDLARAAGCALGAIYTVFGDLSDLVLAVNSRTFDRLGQAISVAPQPVDPVRALTAMATAYHAFARDNHLLWRALFDIERPPGEGPPDWYLARMDALLALIETPLARIDPTASPADLRRMARTLFGAVHGIVYLALDEAGAGLPDADVDDAIALLLVRFAGTSP